MSYVCADKTFESMSEAKVFAESIFNSNGVVAAIEACVPEEEEWDWENDYNYVGSKWHY